ncbi:hypothetical protein ACHAXR_009306 [Thalassiosira sp. AJA248-18]
MTAPSSSWARSWWERLPSTTSKVILSSSSSSQNNQVQNVADQRRNENKGRWATLDFVEIDKSLASRLTDVDVGAILVCINAFQALKKLKLTGCVNITGNGLEILRGSVVLEQIDLSLVGQHERPVIYPEQSISETATLPILDSIIDAVGSSLKYIQLPHAWRKKQSSLLDQFLRRYEVFLGYRRSSCSKCNTLLSENTVDHWWGWIGCDRDHKRKLLYGRQNYTCYSCLKCMCHYCENEHGPLLIYCDVCEKEYCRSCVPWDKFCNICNENFCDVCSKLKECPACDSDRTQEWTCCGMSLPTNKKRCGKYNGWRGGKRVRASDTLLIPPSWECGKCRISNPGAKKRCGGCLAWKGDNYKSSGKSSSSSKGGGGTGRASLWINDNMVEGKTSWECNECNFDNFAGELSCFMCHSLRPNWEWHKKHPVLVSASSATRNNAQQGNQAIVGNVPNAVAATSATTAAAQYPVQAFSAASVRTAALATSARDYMAPTAATVGQVTASNGVKADDATHILPPTNSDSLNYYGRYSENIGYPYVSIHYDFNLSYYTNHDYSYLNSGIGNRKSSTTTSGGCGDDAKGGSSGAKRNPTVRRTNLQSKN